MSFVIFLIVFIVSLTIMITLHEFGHFIVCRRNGVIVEEFSIGMFGPRIVSMKRGDTVYAIRPVLVGAFVKPIGENDPEVQGGLAAQSPWIRLRVFAAGPIANVILGFLILCTFFAIYNEGSWIEGDGLMVQQVEEDSPAAGNLQAGDIITKVDGYEIREETDLREALLTGDKDKNFVIQREGMTLEIPVTANYEGKRKIGAYLTWGLVDEVVPGTPADEVGIRPGDFIFGVNGEAVYSDKSFTDALSIDKESQEATVSFIRDGEVYEKNLNITSTESIGVENRWVADNVIIEKHYGVWEAPIRSLSFLIDLPAMIGKAMPFMKDNPDKAVVGVVGAGHLAWETMSTQGFGVLIFFSGIISIGLAIFNLVPMPPLDGGGILIALIEGIRGGKRLSDRAIQIAYSVGMAIVIMLFVLIMYWDISRLIRGESFL